MILAYKKIQSVTVSIVFLSFAIEWWDWMPYLCFLDVEFQGSFFTLLFQFHQEALLFLFTLCHKGGVICISEVIDISPGNLNSILCLPSLAFCIMYSVYKLNKQDDNIQPWHTPFPILNQSVVPCLVLFLLDLHTDFSGGRSGGLVFPSLEKFPTGYFGPHSQRL